MYVLSHKRGGYERRTAAAGQGSDVCVASIGRTAEPVRPAAARHHRCRHTHTHVGHNKRMVMGSLIMKPTCCYTGCFRKVGRCGHQQLHKLARV